MIEKNIEVLRKILYAVETGGQVYGKQRYDAFIGAGANTPNEKAITIGAGQWYAVEAKRLLQEIQRADPAQFKRLDTQGIADDLLHKNWSRYAISPTSAKAKCIIKIISSSVGIKSQDKLMDIQIREYAENITKTYGSMPNTAMMECINIIHQGGSAALKRILAKTAKPYTSEQIYAALCTDPEDKSNNNQVGDYTTRQKKVVEMIRTYAVEEGTGMTAAEAINTVIGIAEEEIGYLEKRSNRQLDSKTANAGSGNYTKYWRDIDPSYQAQPWCAGFVSWCFYKAFGLAAARKLLKHWPYVYCPDLGNKFTKHTNPKKGDIVIFYRNGTFAHTGIVTKVSGDRFWTIEGNTSGASGIVANGGGVCEKSYYNSQLPGTKFCRPDYSIVTNINPDNGSGDHTTGGHYMFEPKTVEKGDTGLSVLLLQEILIARGFKGKDGKALTLDRVAGTNTVHALKKYQESRKGVLEADGICGDKTWRDLIAL